MGMSIALNLDLLMRARGVSQYKIAKLIGMGQGSVSKILAGNNPKSDTLSKIANALSVSVDELTGSSCPASVDIHTLSIKHLYEVEFNQRRIEARAKGINIRPTQDKQSFDEVYLEQISQESGLTPDVVMRIVSDQLDGPNKFILDKLLRSCILKRFIWSEDQNELMPKALSRVRALSKKQLVSLIEFLDFMESDTPRK